MTKEPDPEKLWELTVHLMAGQRMEPAQALRLVIEARDLAIAQTRADSRSRFPRPSLPKEAQAVWKEIAGEDRGTDWALLPGDVEGWCREHQLREELVTEVRGHVERIVAARPRRGFEFPDTPIMRFVVDLMVSKFRHEALPLGKHLRYFDCVPCNGQQITVLTCLGIPCSLDRSIVIGSDFEDLADQLHRSFPSARALQPIVLDTAYIGPRPRSTSQMLPPVMRSTTRGVEVDTVPYEVCPIDSITLAGGEILYPGFAPS
jgi:hypothetical protein